jgi:hypothetical protein
MSIFRPCHRRHGVPIFKLQHGSHATSCNAHAGRVLPAKGRGAVSRGYNMFIANSHITTALISDFAAGRLDAEDAQVVQEAINRDEVIATAVADASRVNSRMNLWLATSTVGSSAIEREYQGHQSIRLR